MEIVKHKLIGENIIQSASPNNSGKFNMSEMDTIIIHYTAGANAQSSVNTLSNPKVKASAHTVIGKDGTIYQLLPFDTIAWHAGKSQYEGRVGFNKYSIGIELDNPGKLEKTEAGYKTYFGSNVDPDNVLRAIHRNDNDLAYWHTYTTVQIEKAEMLSRLLIETYNIKYILGHEEISPGRKIDPGPAFPLDKFRGKLLDSGRADDCEEDIPEKEIFNVDAPFLNVRKGPGASYDKSHTPLGQNTKVKLIERNGKWLKVRYELEGWVHSDYIS